MRVMRMWVLDREHVKDGRWIDVEGALDGL